MPDVADDPVDVEVSRRHPTGHLDAAVGDHQRIAVLADEHPIAGHSHRLAEAGVGDEMAELAVDRDVPLGPGDREVGLQLVGLGVPGGVDVLDTGVDHFGARPQQTVHHPVDGALVARDRVAREDHGVVLRQLDELVLPAGEQGECGHRLAL